MDGVIKFCCSDCGAVYYMGYAPTYMQRVTIGEDGYLHLKCPDCGGDLISPYIKRDGLIYPLYYISFEQINEMRKRRTKALAK